MAGLYENQTYEDDANEDNSLNISDMRVKYLAPPDVLKEENLVKNPFKLFKEWFESACKCKQIEEPNAMCLATATKDGFPSARYVLLKNFDDNGFTFFTNYSSRKGKELKENPNAAVVFYWDPLHRSVRIEGTTSKIPENESTAYFLLRPKESQIGACVSDQSTVIASRSVLEEKNTKLQKQYEDSPVPRPKHWGGILIKPTRIEFWQGQSNRLHDRILFRRPRESEKLDEVLVHTAEDGWVYERLAP